ncbi:hypothetical protein [Rummeliibacillus suwonensis]|uniref:hypothetical protein n=1 Tax=Rummeliibacillus suwonensis TaxID=1306154 RepID=UPI001AAF80FB|nr:hypothetical protein [Rummeliibacillus suwonensis]MBO2537596.1 hypothetical protein [Rummeliibacillus suwonensis]
MRKIDGGSTARKSPIGSANHQWGMKKTLTDGSFTLFVLTFVMDLYMSNSSITLLKPLIFVITKLITTWLISTLLVALIIFFIPVFRRFEKVVRFSLFFLFRKFKENLQA